MNEERGLTNTGEAIPFDAHKAENIRLAEIRNVKNSLSMS
jgi:hypothetical protein